MTIDLVQKQSSTVSRFEFPFATASFSARESPIGITEKFALDQFLGDGPAIDGHKGTVAAITGAMNRLGKKLFTGTAFAQDKDGGGSRSDPFRFFYGLANGFTFADNIHKPELDNGILRFVT